MTGGELALALLGGALGGALVTLIFWRFMPRG
jgi:hypothetical protein